MRDHPRTRLRGFSHASPVRARHRRSVVGWPPGAYRRSPRRPAPAPLRYRDDIFSTVTQDDRHHLRQRGQRQQGQPSRSSSTCTDPTGDTVTSRPAIVWVHGGSFTRRQQDLARDRRRGERLREEGLRQRLDQVPAPPRLFGGEPEPCIGDLGRAARRAGRGALPAGQRGDVRHRREPHRQRPALRPARSPRCTSRTTPKTRERAAIPGSRRPSRAAVSLSGA